MPDSFHKPDFLDGIYPRPWKRLRDGLPEELASLKVTSALSLSLTTLVFRSQICCSAQIPDLASQVTNTQLNKSGLSGETVGMVCVLVVLEAVLPTVER
jgi:hypothetical protein